MMMALKPKETVNDDVERVDIMEPSSRDIDCCGDGTGLPSKKKIWVLISAVIAVVGAGYPGALLLLGCMQGSKSILQHEYTSTRENPTPGLALLRKLDKEQIFSLQGEPEGETTSRYIEQPDISVHDITQVMDWIKAEMTKNIVPFCWKQSYGRDVGKIPGRPADCPSGYIQDGATCKLPPQDIFSPSVAARCPSGYIHDGATCRLPPEDIYSPSVAAECPVGFRYDGLTCFRDMHTYGKCCTTIWSRCNCESGYVNMGCHCHRDAQILGLEGMTCTDGYSKGQPFLGRCYKRCEGGRTRIGEYCHRTMVIKGLDSMTCPDGYFKGEPFAGRCYKKCEGGRTRIGENCHRTMVVKGIESMTCKEDEEKIGARCFKNGGCGSDEEWSDGLCYKKCRSGYKGEGPVCWQTCDPSQFNCAAACAMDEEECGSTTADQVISTLVLAANIATLGLGSAGSAPVGKLAKVQSRAKTILNTIDSKTLTKLTKQIDKFEGVQDALKVYKKLKPARYGLRVIELSDTVNTYYGWAGDGEQFFDDVIDYTTTAADAFVEITSQEISEELDRRYEPHTSNFFKQQWALIQFSELSEAKGWETALTAMTFVGFVDPDPTGVLGAVAAYTKPICKDVKEFPCIIADKLYASGCKEKP